MSRQAPRGTYFCYTPTKFSAERSNMIEAVNVVIGEYASQGFKLSVRQIYYQFVQRGWLPNEPKSYTTLQRLINDGRLAGLISWTAIEDRDRSLKSVRTYSDPGAAISEARANYRRDLWKGQPWRPEVWIEKKALEGVISSICVELRVDFFATKGYNSQSEQWDAGQRFAGYVRAGQRPIVFHLGDHDPSGIDMTRDNQERLSLFAGTPILVQRLALNMSQIEELRPPPNPAKLSDSRAEDYIARFGESSWELDALDPTYIRRLISDAVGRVRDPVLWDEALHREVGDRLVLDEMMALSGHSRDDPA